MTTLKERVQKLEDEAAFATLQLGLPMLLHVEITRPSGLFLSPMGAL